MKKYLALVHHPIVNKRGELVTTSVTNLDIHDIARSCRTFGFSGYFIVTPLVKQQVLVAEILEHWERDEANEYNPDRQDALSFIHVVSSIEQAAEKIKQIEENSPLICVTGANFKQNDGGCAELKTRVSVDKKPLLLILGTGWGLHSSVVEKADFRLKPILGSSKDGYNHLSVRSAAAIYCGRLSDIALP